MSSDLAEEYLWWLREGGRELRELSSRQIDRGAATTTYDTAPRSQRSQVMAGRADLSSSSGSPSYLGALGDMAGLGVSGSAAQTAAADSCFRVLRLRTDAIGAELAALQREVDLIASASSLFVSPSSRTPQVALDRKRPAPHKTVAFSERLQSVQHRSSGVDTHGDKDEKTTQGIHDAIQLWRGCASDAGTERAAWVRGLLEGSVIRYLRLMSQCDVHHSIDAAAEEEGEGGVDVSTGAGARDVQEGEHRNGGRSSTLCGGGRADGAAMNIWAGLASGVKGGGGGGSDAWHASSSALSTYIREAADQMITDETNGGSSTGVMIGDGSTAAAMRSLVRLIRPFRLPDSQPHNQPDIQAQPQHPQMLCHHRNYAVQYPENCHMGSIGRGGTAECVSGASVEVVSGSVSSIASSSSYSASAGIAHDEIASTPVRPLVGTSLTHNRSSQPYEGLASADPLGFVADTHSSLYADSYYHYRDDGLLYPTRQQQQDMDWWSEPCGQDAVWSIEDDAVTSTRCVTDARTADNCRARGAMIEGSANSHALKECSENRRGAQSNRQGGIARPCPLTLVQTNSSAVTAVAPGQRGVKEEGGDRDATVHGLASSPSNKSATKTTKPKRARSPPSMSTPRSGDTIYGDNSALWPLSCALDWAGLHTAALHHENQLRGLGLSSRIVSEQPPPRSVYTDIRALLTPLLPSPDTWPARRPASGGIGTIRDAAVPEGGPSMGADAMSCSDAVSVFSLGTLREIVDGICNHRARRLNVPPTSTSLPVNPISAHGPISGVSESVSVAVWAARALLDQGAGLRREADERWDRAVRAQQEDMRVLMMTLTKDNAGIYLDPSNLSMSGALSAFLPPGDDGWMLCLPVSYPEEGERDRLSGGEACIEMQPPKSQIASLGVTMVGRERQSVSEVEGGEGSPLLSDDWGGTGMVRLGGGMDSNIANLFRGSAVETTYNASDRAHCAFAGESLTSHAPSCDWGGGSDDGGPPDRAISRCDDKSSDHHQDHVYMEVASTLDHPSTTSVPDDVEGVAAAARAVRGYLASLPVRAIQRLLYETALHGLTKRVPSQAIVRLDTLIDLSRWVLDSVPVFRDSSALPPRKATEPTQYNQQQCQHSYDSHMYALGARRCFVALAFLCDTFNRQQQVALGLRKENLGGNDSGTSGNEKTMPAKPSMRPHLALRMVKQLGSSTTAAATALDRATTSDSGDSNAHIPIRNRGALEVRVELVKLAT